MAKLPAFQFYPGDWRKDPGVQALSYHDRGVWWEMLLLMHESERRGYLLLNGRPMNEESLSRALGLDKQNLTTTLTCLLDTGVASREENSGAIYCRRMVRDENIRKVRSEAGKLGGNPVLVKQKSTTQVNHSMKMKKEEEIEIDPSMFASMILVDCRLGGRDLRMVLEEVGRAEIQNGSDLGLLGPQAVKSWENYNEVKNELSFHWGAAKFFGEGHWREPPEKWPRNGNGSKSRVQKAAEWEPSND